MEIPDEGAGKGALKSRKMASWLFSESETSGFPSSDTGKASKMKDKGDTEKNHTKHQKIISQKKNSSCWNCTLYPKLGMDAYHDCFCQKEDKIGKIWRVIPLNSIYLKLQEYARGLWDHRNIGDALVGMRMEAPSKQAVREFTEALYFCADNRCIAGFNLYLLRGVKNSCTEAMAERNKRHPGLTGLRNLGNTCYMNAILQCLCSVSPLVEFFLSGKYKAALHKENGQSVAAFGCLMSNMWLGEFGCVSPEVFHSALGKRYPAFRNRTQQDAQEFLICVLNELHEALKSSKRQCIPDAKASRGSVSETSIITQLFEGQLSYEITCLECKTTAKRPESFTVLSLPVPSKSACSLQDCLKCFFQQDTLTWNNQIHCSWCGMKQDAVVKSIITRAPQIVIFHLKRFEWQDKHKGKLLTDICYPLSSLDLSPYTSPPLCKHAEYSLCAIVNHSGFLDDGHYTAFCKHSVTKNWYSFDDEQITEIPNSLVQTGNAYLLFYTCQGLPCTP